MRVARQVDQQIAEEAIDDPRRRAALRAICAEGRFQFVEALVAGLVDPRGLARRPDEQAGEQIRQRRPVVPIGHQASQQVGAAEEGTVDRPRAAQHDVVAAAGAGVPAVEHEFLGPQPRAPGLVVERRRVADEFLPVRPTAAS